MKFWHAALLGASFLLPHVPHVVRADEAAADAPTPAAPAADARPTQPLPQAFDPARHMRVAEVKPGMKGHGLSVFKGTKIERFEVEVVAVLKNFNPKADVILIRCKGQNMEHTGAVAGMSGSPIFLKDETGKERMAGAFAYGWPMAKDPVAGVQPIEYMLDTPTTITRPVSADVQPVIEGADGAARERSGTNQTRRPAGGRLSWSVEQFALPWTGGAATKGRPLGAEAIRPGARLSTDFEDTTRLQPLATPLMTAGVSSALMEQLKPAFSALGMVPLQAGGVGGSGVVQGEPAKLEPGAVMAVPLMTGDAEMTAVGTCTEVLGNRVYGFGHPFNNEGQILLPLGGGQVNGVIANLTTSFKLGSMTKTWGRLTSDRAFGVAGEIGEKPPMVPIDLRVTYADGTVDRSYHFDAALHPRFTPLLGGIAVTNAINGANELPQYNTVDYDVTIEFENGEKVRLANRTVNVQPVELFQTVGMPMAAAAENPFERVLVRRITGTIHVTPTAQEAAILEVVVPRSKYAPGEAVRAFVEYKPFRGPEAILPVELELPKDLAEGTYQLIISDYQRFMNDERQSKPFRFTAETAGEVFAALRDFTNFPRNALYVRLLRQPDGVAIGRTALPQLPSSRRQVLIGAGRSNTTRFVSSMTRTVPTELVMGGSAEFAITIDADAKVEVSGAKGGEAPKGGADQQKPAGDAKDLPDTTDPGGEKPAPME